MAKKEETISAWKLLYIPLTVIFFVFFSIISEEIFSVWTLFTVHKYEASLLLGTISTHAMCG